MSVRRCTEAAIFSRLGQRRFRFAQAAAIAMLAAGAAVVALSARPAPDLPVAEETTLLATPVLATTLFRFAPAPAIVVALFPSPHEQAMTLNRVAVFVELAGAPRTRVLDDTTLHATISAAGQSFDEFYEAHDYRAADLARFFVTADRDRVPLNPQERHLRAALDRLRASPAGFGALISLVALGGAPEDASLRAAILRHELSHGAYFTDPAYASMVADFWRNTLTAAQRAGLRFYLARDGYDAGNDDLIRNEAQAYLMHTRDARAFQPADAGLTAAEAATLRSEFVAAMPLGWLHDRTNPR